MCSRRLLSHNREGGPSPLAPHRNEVFNQPLPKEYIFENKNNRSVFPNLEKPRIPWDEKLSLESKTIVHKEYTPESIGGSRFPLGKERE